MKNKWLILCLVFILGLLGSPVFSFDKTEGESIGTSTEGAAEVNTKAIQLETVMETLVATVVLFTGYIFLIHRVLEGPATSAPERYDKAYELKDRLV